MSEDIINCPFCTKPCKGVVGFWSHARQAHRRGVDLILNLDPPQTREEWSDERDLLLERICQLENKLYGMGWTPPDILKLTCHETAILQALMAHERVVSHEILYEATRTAHNALGREVDEKIVCIRISIMRKKLRAFGLKILTVWGRGYQIPAETRQRLLNWNAERATQVVA